MLKKGDRISQVLGVKVNSTSMSEVLRNVERWIESNRGGRYMVTPNPEMVVLAQQDKQFMRALNGADLAIPDGVGLGLADKRLKRVAGVEVMNELIKLAAKKGWRVMLLGGRSGIAERGLDKLKQQYAGLQIEAEAGPQRIEKVSAKENQRLIKRINRFKPDLLLVGFGHGKQEKWIAKNLAKLKVKVAMGVGGAIDVIVKPWMRAPKWLQTVGLEWWWRLMLQPWRIKRQLALMRFSWLVISDKYLGGGQ
jgi:N-acetylglucosaminyldiphosphoundecaprenol N-acetyl-beta-D-mannosaminyltransferase